MEILKNTKGLALVMLCLLPVLAFGNIINATLKAKQAAAKQKGETEKIAHYQRRMDLICGTKETANSRCLSVPSCCLFSDPNVLELLDAYEMPNPICGYIFTSHTTMIPVCIDGGL